MAKFWEKNNLLKTDIQKDKKILLFRNVSIPIWEDSYGPCKKLYNW